MKAISENQKHISFKFSQNLFWESQFPFDQNQNQNPQVLVNDHIARVKDPQEAVSSCHETHWEHWFIQCPTISP